MNIAFVTVLSTNNYYKGVIALFESIRKTNSKCNNFVVVVNETIHNHIISNFIDRGYIVIKKKKLSFNFVHNTSYVNWKNTFDKFYIFDLVEYDKIVYLDSDMYVTKNIDELFELPHMSAVIAGHDRFNSWVEIGSGLMVIEPKANTSLELIKTLQTTTYNKDIGDQDVIETYFNWKDQNLAISENYNMFAPYVDYYINELGYSADDIAVIHFIGNTKPWMLNKKEQEEYINGCASRNELYLLDYFKKYMELINKIGKKLSIITPFYNTINETKRLASILEPQLTNEVEWIIIDDGTNEHELDTLNANVIHLTSNSGNASRPRNVGLDLASGDFVTFIDSDDTVSEDYVEKIINKIDTDKFDYCYFSWQCNGYQYIIEDEPLEWNHSACNCIYKRETIGNERFNEDFNLNEDGDFNDRVKRGKKSNLLDVLYTYYWKERPDSISSLYDSGKLKFNRKDN